jgi:cytochrome c553
MPARPAIAYRSVDRDRADSTQSRDLITIPHPLGRPDGRRFQTELFMSPRSAWLAASLTLAALGVAQTAIAAGDPQRGAKLAYTCHGCHGIPNYKNAYPIYSVPKLGGQHAAYIVVALKAYASQERPHATMHAHAATMSEQDMADMAAYLAGVEIKSTGKAVGAAPKAGQTCVACHGNDGVGILPEYPILSGQHADYLAQSLRGYRSGQRKNAVMAGMAAALTDQDILELAEYYSKQRPSLCSTDQLRKGGKCKGL